MDISSSLLAAQMSYSHWASHKLLTYALTIPSEDLERHIGNSHGNIVQTFQHIYYGDRIWYSRLNGTPRPGTEFADPDPGPSISDLDRDWWPVLSAYEELVRNADPYGVLSYKTLKGQAFERPNWQTILHIVNHGTYHRGQIAAMMRQQGHHPPGTDLIYYYLEQ